MSPATLKRYVSVVLGRGYDLSFTTVTSAKMRSLNRTYRGIDAPTDILSFPLSKKSGEIVLCKSEVKKHAEPFGLSARDYYPYLVIHGLVHLKGLAHGRIMDRLEKKYCHALGLTHPRDISLSKVLQHGTANRSRHRRRHIPSARRRRA